ncbi:MAG: preprotein translocase subunit SecY [Clostridia bacterium]
MFTTLKNAWHIADIRKKLIFTFCMIVLFRMGSAIPVPFINLVMLETVFEAYESTLLGYFNILSGGALSQATLFAMSISPYINASIIIQLLTVAIPALERLAKDGGEEGRKKITKITQYSAIGIALIQAYGYYTLLKAQSLLEKTDAWSAIVIVLTFTAGTALLMWIGDRITERGIGNGTSMILFSGIVASLPTMGTQIYALLANAVSQAINGALTGYDVLYAFLGIFALVLFVAIVAFVVIMNTAERRIPINYAKRVVGRKMMGGQNTHLPIKVSASGVMPIIFASSIVSLPGTLAVFFGSGTEGTLWYAFVNMMQQTSLIYIVIFFLFIIGFSYFYAAMQFNPIEIANNLKKNGGFIPGFRPGRPTTDFISKVLSKVTFVGAMFLGVLATLPLILGAIFPVLSNMALGGTSVVIMVGVALETMRQIESQMMMKHYKGFLE